ncbi:MAG: ABC transporter ATP-binding protein [Myxococcota bacterium]|nr:ABC transporter ATP-binding protein [Myxococcota bacterium]
MSIEVKDLGKRFGSVEAVRTLSFRIEAGEFVGLVGPNGAGKSTTIKMLTGQIFPTAGYVCIGGVDMAKEPNEGRKKIGYVPEFPVLYEYLTAREMISFVKEIRGIGDVEWALDLTGLGDDADRLIREYSQGMRRKTAIACALVAKPSVLILDEALNGLDPPSVERVLKALSELQELGTAIVLSTHVLDTLEKIASRVIMLKDGVVLADCPPSGFPELRSLF